MKIGFVSWPLSGHLNPMTALARKLVSRGNEIVLFGLPDVEPIARAANLAFVCYGEKEFPVGSFTEAMAPASKLHGEELLDYTAQVTPRLIKAAIEYLPNLFKETGVEALALDAGYYGLPYIAMGVGIPFVHIWNCLHTDLTGTTPLFLYSWPHETTPEAHARNIEGLKMLAKYAPQIMAITKPYVDKMGMQVDWNDPFASTSKLAIITQTPREFDFPNPNWPAHFHYAGPFHDGEGREQVPFPWERLNGNPLIYASMGTIVNGMEHVYHSILGAAGRLPGIQFVLSIGKNIHPDKLGTIPSNTIVVSSAPQMELLKKATLCITHAGLNTTLESLTQGVPMVAIPIGYDQPGVAARIAYHGVGEFMELEDVTVERLLTLIQRVQENPSYRDKAQNLKRVIERTHGLDVAAGIIEKAFKTDNRVA
jgi:zeaxanthin glucosyltransferase